MDKLFKFVQDDEEYDCFIQYYPDGHLISIMYIDEDGCSDDFMYATTTPAQLPLAPGQVAITDDCKRWGMLDKLVELGVIYEPDRKCVLSRIQDSVEYIYLCRVNDEIMAQWNCA